MNKHAQLFLFITSFYILQLFHAHASAADETLPVSGEITTIQMKVPAPYGDTEQLRLELITISIDPQKNTEDIARTVEHLQLQTGAETVAVYEPEDSSVTYPSDIHQKITARLQNSGSQVERYRIPHSILSTAPAMYKFSAKDGENNSGATGIYGYFGSTPPIHAEYRLGFVRAAIAGSIASYVYFVEMNGVSAELAAAMTMLQATLAAVHSIWARTFDQLFVSPLWNQLHPASPRQEAGRRFIYSIFINEMLRALIGPVNGLPPIDSLHGQLNIFTYCALAGVGDVILSSARNRAYADYPLANARFNFFSYVLTLPFIIMEANHVAGSTLIDMSFYEFTDTTLLMLITNLGLAAAVKWSPDHTARILVDRLDDWKDSSLRRVAGLKGSVQRREMQLTCQPLLDPKKK